MLAKYQEIGYGPGVPECGKSNPANGKDAKAVLGGEERGYFKRATSNSSMNMTTGIISSMV
jgi:hypothetical protein